MAEIRSKTEMYALYYRGAFGNMLTTWPSVAAFKADLAAGRWPEDKPVALRLASKPGITPPRYCVPTETWEVDALVAEWATLGIAPNAVSLNELGRDDQIVLQGEVQRSERGLDLRASRVPKVMRQALTEDQFHLSGLRATMTLRGAMDASSWDNLQRLFDDYPNAVVEFSVYSIPVGTEQRNTIFWETRNY